MQDLWRAIFVNQFFLETFDPYLSVCVILPFSRLYKNLKILSRANSLIANNNIRTVGNQNGRCKIVTSVVLVSSTTLLTLLF